jgi:hypothetical protein
LSRMAAATISTMRVQTMKTKVLSSIRMIFVIQVIILWSDNQCADFLF